MGQRGSRFKTISLPLPQKPTQTTTQGSFLSSLTSHVWSGVRHHNSRKRNTDVVGPWPEGWRADSAGSLLETSPAPGSRHQGPLGATFTPGPRKEHVFPRISCCQGFPKTDMLFLFGCIDEANVCLREPDLLTLQGKLPLCYNSGEFSLQRVLLLAACPSPMEESL